MKKNWAALILLHFFLLIGSCESDNTFDDCDCGGISSVQIDFTGLRVNSLESIGNDFRDTRVIDGSISKENFLLEIDLPFNETFITSSAKRDCQSFFFGFSSAYACTCAYPTFLNNTVGNIRIFMSSTGEDADFVDASANFQVVDFFDSEGFFTIEEAILATREAENSFSFVPRYQLRISDESAIPNTVVLKVMVAFSDDTEREQKTTQITFL
ncbi:MAG: hypothetical protein AAF039_17360 [Bacteroidota bacterium]